MVQSLYIGGLHYESQSSATPVLKFVSTSEGRVVKSGATWKYEYFHKDHLGNVRSVYGYMPQVDSYTATMETTVSAKEEAMFRNVAATRKIGHNHTLPAGDYTSPNYAAETNGFVSGKAVGPAKVLQVSAGDTVDIEVFATYQNEVGSSNNVISSLAAALTSAFGLGSGEIAYQTIHSNIGTIAGGISRDGDAAKAYLFYVVLDNNYNYVGSGQSAGFASITTNAENAWERLHLNILVPHNGYLYTCVVNESSVSGTTSVYFDDLKIVHSRTTSGLQVVQVQDYYPFGLTYNSYSREMSLPNQYQYNGKESQDELDLGWYDYIARNYNAAIGRFLSVDPAADLMRRVSPYAYAFNNPLRFTDPDGMVPEDKSLTVESTDNDGTHRDVVTETTTTSKVVGTRTVKRGSDEFVELVGKSDITMDNGIGDEVIVTTTEMTTTTVTTTLSYDAEGKLISQSQAASAETTTFNEYSVMGADGKSSGGFMETTGTVSSNNTDAAHSKNGSAVVNAAIDYRSKTKASINTMNRFADMTARAEKFNESFQTGSAVADVVLLAVKANFGYSALSFALGIVADKDLQELRNKNDSCDNCIKKY